MNREEQKYGIVCALTCVAAMAGIIIGLAFGGLIALAVIRLKPLGIAAVTLFGAVLCLTLAYNIGKQGVYLFIKNINDPD
ncbi:MAG: hypothetical protein LUC22_02310 [Prevotella sp.]|nr:hypothetical protein [Prevotella sp.]